MKPRSKSEVIRGLIDKGLTKPEIVKKTGYSQQLVYVVYTNYKGKVRKKHESPASVVNLLRKAIRLLSK
jgi:hypothetical protein